MSQAGFRVTGMIVYCAPLPYMAHQVGDYFSIRGFAATQKSPRVPMQWRQSFHVSLIAYVNPTILRCSSVFLYAVVVGQRPG
ncbi:unnamed protein product [Protopolystoma xenopodis]|uniref:Uncharacterized protein n=1 Tax=Protopolystoma xenopodis TaxID=117903 RepID=A0A3S5CQL5_9PLAT|nr:unnamed protein product [Protopolystoma xenopodis]